MRGSAAALGMLVGGLFVCRVVCFLVAFISSLEQHFGAFPGVDYRAGSSWCSEETCKRVCACMCVHTQQRELVLFCLQLGRLTGANPNWGWGSFGPCTHLEALQPGGRTEDHPWLPRAVLGQKGEQMQALLRFWSRITV